MDKTPPFVNLGLHSWSQMIGYAERRLTEPAVPGAGESSKSDRGGWNGSGSLQAAVSMARTGWQEGAAAVGRTLDRVTPAQDVLPDWCMDVAGAFPCVPAAMAGEPECVWRLTDDRRAVRRLALVVNGTYHAAIGADSVMVYAKAVAATARAIEASGIDVAIYSVVITGGRELCVYGTRIREYGEPLDLAKVAFAFHPAWLRRIGFAFRELTPGAVAAGIAAGGYGRPDELTAALVSAFLGDVGAPAVCLPGVSKLGDRGKLCESNLSALIELFRNECDKSIAAAGGIPA